MIDERLVFMPTRTRERRRRGSGHHRTLPLNASQSVGGTLNAATGIYAYAELWGTAGVKSCMQLVVNNSDGSRFSATTPACTFAEGLMSSGASPIALPGNLKDFNAYENITLGPAGKFKYASFSMVYP